MRIDRVAPLTIWLAGFAGCAVVAWLSTLAGLGGRIAPLSDDALQRPGTPHFPAAQPERLQPLPEYSGIASRPVFATDRKPHPFQFAADENVADAVDLRLTGVVISPQLRMATLTTMSGESLRLSVGGEAVNGWRLLSLEPREATLEGAGGVQTLVLEVYRGADGSYSPQVLSTTSASPQQVADAANTVQGDTGTEGMPSATPADEVTSSPPSTGVRGMNGPPPDQEQQIEIIRHRIEVRRQQLREQSTMSPAPQTDTE